MSGARLFRFAAGVLAAAGLVGGMSSIAHAQPDPKVIGGYDVSTDDFPWVVALANASSIGNGRSGQFCGGTLAAAHKVVTAAHCVVNRSPGNTKVVVGRTDLGSQDGTVVDVTDIWVHPDFVNTASGSDVAVLTLGSDVAAPTLPIGTPADDLYQPGTPATLLGWGRVDNSSSAKILQAGDLNIVDDGTCSSIYGGSFIQSAHVCAGSDTSRQCNGDSGGPLVVNGKLAGIVSFSKKPCVPVVAPGVLTRVATYSDIIAQQIGG